MRRKQPFSYIATVSWRKQSNIAVIRIHKFHLTFELSCWSKYYH